MSSLTTTTIDTANGATDLTVRTGNTSGPSLVIGATTNITARSNNSTNIFSANSTGLITHLPLRPAGNLVVNSISTFTANVVANSVAAVAITSNTISTNSTITAPNVSITSNTLSLGTAVISSSGYTRLPNGLLMQWGSVASNTSVGNITFSVPFTSIYSFTHGINVAGAYNSTYQTQTIALTTSTANVRTGNTTSKTVYWTAIGS